ncbi:MAG: hypothetical protein JOZ52_12930 [Acidobacteria bacterium]|nr:hypothetical protein [Acidobacteriota bacterium]
MKALLKRLEMRTEGASPLMNEERRYIYAWELLERPRLLTAGWFAVAGAIPGFVIMLLLGGFRNGTGTVMLMWLATAAIAALYGGALGVEILKPESIGKGSQAFGQGCLVAALSFVTFIFLISVLTGMQQGRLDFFTVFFTLMIFGSLLVGWAVVLLGGLAGWLLFKRYRCRVVGSI